MSDTDGVIGDEPLADGMVLSIRLRMDFVVRDAAALLAAARRAYLELNPGQTEADAQAQVTCAADALFTILEREGVLGGAADVRLSERQTDGLEHIGGRAQVVPNQPAPLYAGRDCLRTDDVFALPV